MPRKTIEQIKAECAAAGYGDIEISEVDGSEFLQPGQKEQNRIEIRAIYLWLSEIVGQLLRNNEKLAIWSEMVIPSIEFDGAEEEMDDAGVVYHWFSGVGNKKLIDEDNELFRVLGVVRMMDPDFLPLHQVGLKAKLGDGTDVMLMVSEGNVEPSFLASLVEKYRSVVVGEDGRAKLFMMNADVMDNLPAQLPSCVIPERQESAMAHGEICMGRYVSDINWKHLLKGD